MRRDCTIDPLPLQKTNYSYRQVREKNLFTIVKFTQSNTISLIPPDPCHAYQSQIYGENIHFQNNALILHQKLYKKVINLSNS